MALSTIFADGDGTTKITDIKTFSGDGSIAAASSRHLSVHAVVASGDLSIFCVGASRIDIDELQCENLTIHVGYSSNVTIQKLTVTNQCSVTVHYASEMWLMEGKVKNITGRISYSSFGKRAGKVTVSGLEDVKTDHDGKYVPG